MLGKIKTYLLAALSVTAAVFAALFYRSQAKREQALRKGVQAARKVESKAMKAVVTGLERRQEAVKNAKKRARTRRDHFSK